MQFFIVIRLRWLPLFLRTLSSDQDLAPSILFQLLLGYSLRSYNQTNIIESGIRRNWDLSPVFSGVVQSLQYVRVHSWHLKIMEFYVHKYTAKVIAGLTFFALGLVQSEPIVILYSQLSNTWRRWRLEQTGDCLVGVAGSPTTLSLTTLHVRGCRWCESTDLLPGLSWTWPTLRGGGLLVILLLLLLLTVRARLLVALAHTDSNFIKNKKRLLLIINRRPPAYSISPFIFLKIERVFTYRTNPLLFLLRGHSHQEVGRLRAIDFLQYIGKITNELVLFVSSSQDLMVVTYFNEIISVGLL